MFKAVLGGSSEEIQGLVCQKPKEGHIWDPIGNKWLKIGVYQRSSNLAECWWEIDPRWKLWKTWEKEEAIRKKTEPGFRHAQLQKFKKEMWEFRRGGFWFMNHKTPTYITGRHWYYLSVYHLDTGLPKYRDVDRKYFYAVDYAFEDPESYGLVELTKRRNGKSYRAGCVALEATSREDNFVSGIQSKNELDAGKFFKKCIIAPYRKLPQFFKPKNSNLKGTGAVAPKTGLKFMAAGSEFEDDELASMIDAQSSGEAAYDGQKLKLHIGDEVGKTSECDVYERLRTIIPCLEDEENKVIGNTLHTTTVEDMGPDNLAFPELWADSDQNHRTENGRTVSGLYRIFFSADETRDLDRYGIANRDLARKNILARRIGKDTRALSSEKRKNPLNEDEALQTDASACPYNPEILNELESVLRAVGDKVYVRGNFQWKDGIRDSEVEFRENPEGKFKIAWMPGENIRNRKKRKGGGFSPLDPDGGEIGIDPYDHRILAERGQYTMSLGAIVGIKRPDPLAEEGELSRDGGPAFIYMNRPDSPDIFYEDCVMAAHFYGWKCLIETNKPGCQEYFEDRLYAEYTHWLPGRTKRGIDASAQSKGGGTAARIAEVTDQFINDFAYTVKFLELVLQWKKFTPADTTKWDLAMAFGYAYMMMKRERQRTKKERSPVSVASLFGFAKQQRHGMLR